MKLSSLALLCAALLSSPAEAVETARPWIGIQLDGPGKQGVKIAAVYDGTPGQKAGLKGGDEVTKLDGVAVKTPEELIGRVQQKGVGETVALELLRGGKTFTVKLKLEARPDEVKLLRDSLLGKQAPDFAMAQALGPYAAKLAELKGNVIVLEFFATWCGPCRSAIPRVSEWHQKYAGKGLRIVAVSTEDWAEVARFAKDRKIPYTVAADPEGKVSAGAYHVPAIPTLLVIDRQGIVRHVDVGAGEKLDAAEAVFLPLLEPAK